MTVGGGQQSWDVTSCCTECEAVEVGDCDMTCLDMTGDSGPETGTFTDNLWGGGWSISAAWDFGDNDYICDGETVTVVFTISNTATYDGGGQTISFNADYFPNPDIWEPVVGGVPESIEVSSGGSEMYTCTWRYHADEVAGGDVDVDGSCDCQLLPSLVVSGQFAFPDFPPEFPSEEDWITPGAGGCGTLSDDIDPVQAALYVSVDCPEDTLTLDWSYQCRGYEPETGSEDISDICDGNTVIEDLIVVSGCTFGDQVSANEEDMTCDAP